MKYRPALSVLALIVSATSAASAQTTTPAAEMPAEKQQALVAAVQKSFVIVEYQLQYDKGEAPAGTGFMERCPRCGGYHGNGSFESMITQERPLEYAGILADATHVIMPDLQIHPRFIKGIKVRRYTADGKSDQTVDATISAYPNKQNAVMLELSGALTGATPPTFDAKKAGPYSVVDLAFGEGLWRFAVESAGGGVVVTDGKSVFTTPRGLIVDKEGAAVGISTGVDMPSDGSWKMSPLQWPTTPAAAMNDLVNKVEAQAAKGIVRVTLNFRSPKNSGSASSGRFRASEDESTVQEVMGVVTDARTVLILADFKPAVTARLERIRIHTTPPVEAKFKASLADFTAFVVETETAIAGAPAFSKANVLDQRDAAIPAADISLQGEKRVAYAQVRRIAGFDVGWRGNIYPTFAGGTENLFLFDSQGDLLAIPCNQREKAGMENRYGSTTIDRLTPVAQISRALSALAQNSDPNNVPLTEEQESRLAYVGVEMQRLNRELARANGVSDQTRDGQSGALITYVYPDSPAGKAGVSAGWVLLRVSVEGRLKPIEVEVEQDYSDRAFPWERLSELDEEFFERIPTPWPSAENSFFRTLTDLGFGKKFVAEFWHDGKIEKKEFTIAEGPAHFANAAKYKNEALGLTVKEITYEVRRYLQKREDEPGVIVGKIELGSKASVAGLKPYEVITHVNDQAVKNIKDFEKFAANQTELRLSVKRMTNGRIVRISIPAGTAPGPGGN